MRDRVSIVGIGHSAYAPRGGLAEVGDLRLALIAIRDACDDAGIDVADVDGFSSFCEDASKPSTLSLALGTKSLNYAGMVWGGGGSGMAGAFTNAVLAILSGAAKTVVVVRSITQGRVRYGRPPIGDGQSIDGPASYTVPFGSVAAVHAYALRARRHMAQYGTTIDHFAEISVTSRANAATNPDALFREPITMSDHHASRIISDPLRLLDCCMESDGAAAVVLTSTELARDLRHPPVTITGACMTGALRFGNLVQHALADDEYASAGQHAAATRLYEIAGVGPSEIDVVMVYDHFTPMVLLGLEDFGFCGKGESGPFVAEGNIRRDGSLPMNTHGGHLGEVYLMGVNHVMEAVRQLRGSSANQVPAETALVISGTGSVPTGGLILRR